MVTDGTRTVGWRTVQAGDPQSELWMHSGIALLADGRLVYGALGGGGLVILDLASGRRTTIDLPIAAAHAIAVVAGDEGDEGERLWIADPGPDPGTDSARDPGHDGGVGQVLQVSLMGEILVRMSEPPVPSADGAWRPTSVLVLSGTGGNAASVWIADGYGSNRVFRLDADGSTVVVDAAEGRAFDCPHGLAVDGRSGEPLIVVADRANRRLVWLDASGAVRRTLVDERMTSPSCLVVRGDDLVVTDLFGQVLTVDRDDRVSVLSGNLPDEGWPGWPNRIVEGRTVAPELNEGMLNSPHGVGVDADGDVYVTEWVLGGRVVRLRPAAADTSEERQVSA